MVSEDMVSEDCTTIAFYGISTSARSKFDFYQTVIDWFNEIGYPANKLSVHSPGHSGKPVSFSRANSKLLKQGFETAKSFTIFSTLPECRIPVCDYYLISTYSVRTVKSGYAFVVTRSSISDLSDSSIFKLAEDISTILQPEYGIGYNRMHNLGPEMYAIGIGKGFSMSKEDRKESSRISRWGLQGMDDKVYCSGLLRGVYQWNFLSDLQLDSKVNDSSLKEWIEQEETRGSLTKISDSMTLWKVDKINTSKIELELFKHGKIFE